MIRKIFKFFVYLYYGKKKPVKILYAVQALFYLNKKVLVVERRSGLFGFPSGKVEEGESIENAVIRELYEETGLKGIKLVLIHIEYFDNKYQYVFTVAIHPGKFVLEEGREVRLMSIEEFIEKSEFPEYNMRVLEKVNLI